MTETDKKVIDNHNGNEENERENMRSALASKGGVTSFQELIFGDKRWDLLVDTSQGIITNTPGITEVVYCDGIKRPADLRDISWLLKGKGDLSGRDPPSKVARSQSPCCNPFLFGGPTLLDVSSPDSEAHIYAAEAVKEYNRRLYKDKMELVKVKGGNAYAVSGRLYEITFIAKVVADGEGEKIQPYEARVWRKIGGTLEVISFKLLHDAQGTYKPPLRLMGHGFVRWKQSLWKQGQVAYIRPSEDPAMQSEDLAMREALRARLSIYILDWPFRGHLWAEPSVDRLRILMRHVMRNPEEGMSRGRRAREDMRNKYSPEIVAEIVTHPSSGGDF